MGHAHLHHHHQKRDFWEDVGSIIDGLPESASNDAGEKLQRVYKTMAPTFSGEIGGYSTQGQDSPQQTEQSVAPKVNNNAEVINNGSNEVTSSEDPEPTATAAPNSITSPVEATSLGTTLAVADSTSTPAPTHQTQQMTSSSSLPSPTASSVLAPSSKSSADEGTSAGAKAGIAFGVLGGVLLVALIVFMVFNRRKRQLQRQRLSDNEKLNGRAGSDGLARMPSHSDPRAPRISLRPVTQFLPNWNLDKNAPRGGTANNPAAANQWDRPGTSQSNHPNNPFGSGAERINAPGGPARDPWTANGPAVAAGAAAGAVGAAALTRKTSMRKESQRDVDLTVPGTLDAVPPSPAGTEFSVSSMPLGATNPPSQSAAAIAAAGGPPGSAVHRVQLDFKPTLEDEMELRAGDLVRLLHEYDDGWALCIRLDRSQQGVVPRTCLSTRPVKPRPPQGAPRPGPPINPQGGFPRGPNQPARPMTPQGRPMTPQGQRPPQAMGPRPGGAMSPGPRPQSPGPRYQGPPGGRPQSPNGMNARPMGAPGPSPMNPAPTPQSPNQAPQRKPVPGQAY
ncbi:hypothetical protein PWT90_00592 [Aphanocladium album]|nr:hypothetical protein PWT90_00592 [Aphanocladium album]